MNTEGGRLAGGESKEEHGGGSEIESRKGIEQMGVYCARKYLGAWRKTKEYQ